MAPPVDRQEAVAAIGSALYDEAAWPSLGAALQRADGGDGTGLRPLSNQQTGRKPDGSRDNSTDAQLAVRCGEGGRVADPVALAVELKRLSPVFGDDNGVDACRFWPAAAERYEPGAVLAKGAPPILVVATTGDPATPLPGGKALATALHSGVLMALDGNRHVAYGRNRSPCVESAVARYLIDLVPPADGTQCPREAVHR